MTSTMSRLVLTSALALGALAVFGGFTPGAATAEAAPNVSPFSGSWSGTWSRDGEVRGTFAWTISDAGRIDGTLTHAGSTDGDGGMAGHVSEDGRLTFVGMVPADTPGNVWGNGFHFKGTAEIDDDGRLVALVTLAAAPFAHSLVVILERN